MANKVYNMEGGLHSAAAYSAFENSLYGSCVASDSDFVCTAGTGMTVQLTAGDGLISTGTGFARRIGSDATNTITITAASNANPRMDAIVAYIDNSVTPVTTVIDNTNNILNFVAVAGTPAATPTAPSSATIQTAIGAGNPYMVLWYVTVPANATALNTATFTDNRTIAGVSDGSIVTSKLADGAVTTAKLAANAVTNAKIDFSTLKFDYGTATPNTSINYSSYDFGSYTIPESGVYVMIGGAFINVAGAYDRSIRIMKNSTEVIRKTQNLGSRQMFSIEYAGSFTTGDVVKFNLSANAENFTPQNYPMWAIFKIGA